MSEFKQFINDVTNDAFLKAVENQSGKITIPELDQIIYQHPYYGEVSLDTIEDAVIEIEQILEREGRLATGPTPGAKAFMAAITH